MKKQKKKPVTKEQFKDALFTLALYYEDNIDYLKAGDLEESEATLVSAIGKLLDYCDQNEERFDFFL